MLTISVDYNSAYNRINKKPSLAFNGAVSEMAAHAREIIPCYLGKKPIKLTSFQRRPYFETPYMGNDKVDQAVRLVFERLNKVDLIKSPKVAIKRASTYWEHDDYSKELQGLFNYDKRAFIRKIALDVRKVQAAGLFEATEYNGVLRVEGKNIIGKNGQFIDYGVCTSDPVYKHYEVTEETLDEYFKTGAPGMRIAGYVEEIESRQQKGSEIGSSPFGAEGANGLENPHCPENYAKYMTKFKDLVKWFAKRKRYMVMDYHVMGGKPSQYKDKAVKFFDAFAQYVAEEKQAIALEKDISFDKVPNFVIYDVINEPGNVTDEEVIDYVIAVIDTVLKHDKNAIFQVSSAFWAQRSKAMKIISEMYPGKIVHARHNYPGTHGKVSKKAQMDQVDTMPIKPKDQTSEFLKFHDEGYAMTHNEGYDGDCMGGDTNRHRAPKAYRTFRRHLRYEKIGSYDWCLSNNAHKHEECAQLKEGTSMKGPWIIAGIKEATSGLTEHLIKTLKGQRRGAKLQNGKRYNEKLINGKRHQAVLIEIPQYQALSKFKIGYKPLHGLDLKKSGLSQSGRDVINQLGSWASDRVMAFLKETKLTDFEVKQLHDEQVRLRIAENAKKKLAAIEVEKETPAV